MKKVQFLILFISNIAVLSAQDSFQLAPPLLKYASMFFTKEAKIEMFFAEPNTEIHFTTNGAEPTERDPIYKTPLSITTNFTRVKARVFSKTYQASEVVEALFIKDGLPIHSVECTPPSPKYAGSGATTLIDNKGGTTVLSKKTWLGFRVDTVGIVLNLKKKQKVKKVLLNLLQDYGSWIFLPQKIDAFYFDDKTKSYQFADNLVFMQDKDVKGSFCTPSVLMFKNGVKTDKIRLQVYLVKQIPDWHVGKGSKSWIFIDEIKIY
jgi:Chitobiase/beta-hexosaminidase C-terminal domain